MTRAESDQWIRGKREPMTGYIVLKHIRNFLIALFTGCSVCLLLAMPQLTRNPVEDPVYFQCGCDVLGSEIYNFISWPFIVVAVPTKLVLKKLGFEKRATDMMRVVPAPFCGLQVVHSAFAGGGFNSVWPENVPECRTVGAIVWYVLSVVAGLATSILLFRRLLKSSSRSTHQKTGNVGRH